MDIESTTIKTGAASSQTSTTSSAQTNTTEPRGPKEAKPKKKKRARPVVAGPPKLFHDALTLELGRKAVADNQSLDPRSFIGRLTYSASQPNLRVLEREPTDALRPKSLDSRPIDASITELQSKDKAHPKFDGHTFTLDHFAALSALESLIQKHGRISHMGILDPSYSFFMNKARTAALYYKVKNRVAVVGGDPLCEKSQWPGLLQEFESFRKKKALGIAYLGASDEFAKYAMEQKGWVSMRFGRERALNPLTNDVLLEKEGKRIVKQNRQLLDPQRGNMKINVYVPAQKQDLELQAQLMNVYEGWRRHRNESGRPQAYMTIFDPFALPHLMVYIYSSGADGVPNGLAALRRMDATGGYHIDPYCALPIAPKGTSDLLIYAALTLLHRANVPYLGLGFEPSAELSDIHGLSAPMTRIMKSAYRRTCSRLPIHGKAAFHDKWHPDARLDAALYIIYPGGRPDLNHSLATMHFANVSAREVMKGELKDRIKKLSGSIKKPQVDDKHRSTKAPSVSTKSTSEKSEFSSGPKVVLHSIHSGLFKASQVSLHFGFGRGKLVV